ncbi:unnamed protein product [Aureobasidium uvarum]|uniref:Uncharacterized protein n=1 Tax=Aureobasidium uvarum TaxID=2773716 RepID=A0A9N8KIK7_9PEZI|nr:unnamed protein product [Aureobasidium uvarum]
MNVLMNIRGLKKVTIKPMKLASAFYTSEKSLRETDSLGKRLSQLSNALPSVSAETLTVFQSCPTTLLQGFLAVFHHPSSLGSGVQSPTSVV